MTLSQHLTNHDYWVKRIEGYRKSNRLAISSRRSAGDGVYLGHWHSKDDLRCVFVVGQVTVPRPSDDRIFSSTRSTRIILWRKRQSRDHFQFEMVYYRQFTLYWSLELISTIDCSKERSFNNGRMFVEYNWDPTANIIFEFGTWRTKEA